MKTIYVLYLLENIWYQIGIYDTYNKASNEYNKLVNLEGRFYNIKLDLYQLSDNEEYTKVRTELEHIR
jgi:hypothetical protein